jgi:hypothetical protein
VCTTEHNHFSQCGQDETMTTKQPVVLVSLIGVLAFGMLAVPARGAQGRGGSNKNNDKRETADAKKAKPARDANVIVVDQAGDRRVVQEFYSRGSLPPGLAKRESLPPGLSKQLRERGQLPPGLQKRLTPVPSALGRRLPAMPAHYTRYFAGRDLIYVDTRTNRIVSIIRDIRP